MELTNNYTDAGKEATCHYFAKHLLKLSPEQLIESHEEHAFKQKISEFYDLFQIHTMTEKECVYELKNFVYDFGPVQIKTIDSETINRVLNFIKSDKYLIVSMGEMVQMTFATVSSIPNHPKTKWILEEHVRFPSVALTLAALTYNEKIFLRRDCYETIYLYKWLPLYNNDPIYISSMFPAVTISEYIKHYVFKSLPSLSKEAYKKQMINEVATNVLYHEWGHVITYQLMHPETTAIMKKSTILDYLFFETCDEVLADIAPVYQNKKGVLSYLSDLSKTNPDKAKRLFYIYCSDTWFFDTADTFMFDYSELIQCVLCRYIDPQTGDIHFYKMSKDFDIENPRSFLTVFMTLLNTMIQEFKSLIMTQEFTINERSRSFVFVSNIAKKQVLEKKPMIDQQSYDYYCFYWANMMVFINQFIKDKDPINEFLENSRERIYMLFSKLLFKKSHHSNEVRQRIFDVYQSYSFFGDIESL